MPGTHNPVAAESEGDGRDCDYVLAYSSVRPPQCTGGAAQLWAYRHGIIASCLGSSRPSDTSRYELPQHPPSTNPQLDDTITSLCQRHCDDHLGTQAIRGRLKRAVRSVPVRPN